MRDMFELTPSGNKIWTRNGRYHREDGPAFEFANGTKKWFLKGGLHRTDGPAVEWHDGSVEWHLNGREVTVYDVLGESKEATWWAMRSS